MSTINITAAAAIGVLLLFYLIVDYRLYVDTSTTHTSQGARTFVDHVEVRTRGQLTIRVNTFRRNDLVADFLKYYHTCPVVAEIQVVWSDTDASPPASLLKMYSVNGSRYSHQKKEIAKEEVEVEEEDNNRDNRDTRDDIDDRAGRHIAGVKFEIHKKNSLANRFKPLLDIHTDAVLSIDDDLIVPCEYLEEMLQVWRSNPLALVGHSPRMHGYDLVTGSTRYMRWQHTWWSGIYSIMLTKIAIIHKNYLKDFANEVTDSVLHFIDENRNCEDIAMAHLVASKSRAAPVWTDGLVYEVGQSGISSGSSHFSDRGHCLEFIRDQLGDWPWVEGYQKVVKVKAKWDIVSLWK